MDGLVFLVLFIVQFDLNLYIKVKEILENHLVNLQTNRMGEHLYGNKNPVF